MTNMADWFFYTEDRAEKIGPISARVLKQLALHRIITRETFVVDPSERTGLAKDVKGLIFPESTLSKLPPIEYRSNFDSIFEAASKGTVEDVRYFVEKNSVSVHAKSKKGLIPLHSAAGNSNVDVVKYLRVVLELQSRQFVRIGIA